MSLKGESFDLDVFIERNKLIISSILMLALLVGLILLYLRENRWKPAIQLRVDSLELSVKKLQKENNDLVLQLEEIINSSSVSGESVNSDFIEPQKTESVTSDSKTVPNKTSLIRNGIISGKINLNTATLSQLDTLPGIGQTYAQRIIDYRNIKGRFSTIEEVMQVKGIGQKTFLKFKDQIVVD